MIENTKNYKLSAVYGVLTVTTGLFADTDSSTLALNLDYKEKRPRFQRSSRQGVSNLF